MSIEQITLQVSGLASLLLLRARSDHQLNPPFTLGIQGEKTSPPWFEMAVEYGHDYIIAGLFLNGASVKEITAIELRDATDYALTGTLDVGQLCLDTLLPSQLSKVSHGLIEALPRILETDREALLKALAIKNVDVLLLKDGRIYIHFVHALFDCTYQTATLDFQYTPDPPIAINLRFVQGHVYGLSQHALTSPLTGKANIAILQVDNLGAWVLALKKPRRAADDKALLAVFSPMVPSTLRSALMGLEGVTLRGYCFDEDKPYQALAVDAYLDGQYQTRLLAEHPGIEFNGKPLNAGWFWTLDAAWLQGEAHEIDLVCAESQQRLATCPYRLGADVFDATFQLDDGQTLRGQIKARGLRLQPPVIVVHIDGEALALSAHPIQNSRLDPLPCWQVEISLPPQLNDGCLHQVRVQLTQDDRLLFQTQLSYQAQYVGTFDQLDNKLVSGWIYQKQAPHKPVNLDLLINGRVVAQVLANHWPKATIKLTQEGNALACGFYFRLAPTSCYETSREISLRIAGTQTNVLGAPVLFTPYDRVISALERAQAVLHDAQPTLTHVNGVQTQAEATHWVRHQVIAPIIQALRTAKHIPSDLKLEFSDSIRLPYQHPHDPIVDIIVPVFKGLQETLVCLRSVLDHTQQSYELIVINDASPDTALTKMLHGWASTGAFTFLENPKNLGFVATVNYGMRQHPNRDVVLLNADTIVTAGWLERLQAAAMSAANIATATPLSNNANLLSFPLADKENPMPGASALSELAQQCAKINNSLVIDIPTATGFCMYIKRQALDEVGEFDESSFGLGYAEENDFCLRASTLGWRHVAACDVFVAHHGAKSFQDKKSALIARNLQMLNTKYPDYAMTIDRFVAQDSLRLARNGLIRALLNAHAESYVLFVMHALGGGAKTYADTLAQRLQACSVAVLELSKNAHGQWQVAAYGQPYCLNYQGDNAFEEVRADLIHLGVGHIHYHQVLHYPQLIWTLPEKLGVEYDVTLHDYYAVCPTINMIDETGQYCGDSQLDSANCNRCLRLNDLEYNQPGLGLKRQFDTLGSTINAWRDFHRQQLNKARRVFAPSQSTADIILQHYELTNLSVQPHPEQSVQITPAIPVSGLPYRIAIIGAIGIHKGYKLLVNCAKSALKNGLPLEFIIFGHTWDDLQLKTLENVKLTGRYTPEELPEKLANSGCHIAAFLSVWPETFSYTLSEAWRAGLYPLAFDLGAMTERIKETGYGKVIPLTQDAKLINAALMDIAEHNNPREEPIEFSVGREYPHLLKDYYRFDYQSNACPLCSENFDVNNLIC